MVRTSTTGSPTDSYPWALFFALLQSCPGVSGWGGGSYNASGMTTTTTEPKIDYARPKHVEDPEQYRMSIGEHLEELRWRLILAMIGFVAVFFICLYFGNDVVAYFCRPLLVTL